ncbi:hypothetical protein [Gloeobacter violaceus]|uniref:hypothetical protein n=1 Tax=Gloeobacter violaceus TaxID=33072 RepID=UPI0013E8A14A|nr:hypothetical protein [Gloeobacter violaceus]
MLTVRGDRLRVRLDTSTGASTPFTTSQGRIGRIDYANTTGTGDTFDGRGPVDIDKLY